uniref:Uncharacterized protein n=1 Tax=Anguilla anguilla TaxID=7936 RepID=A0A0E9R0Z5_ANGAN
MLHCGVTLDSIPPKGALLCEVVFIRNDCLLLFQLTCRNLRNPTDALLDFPRISP